MPVRENPDEVLETRTHDGHSCTLPVYKWKESADLVQRADSWNKTAQETARLLLDYIKGLLPDKSVDVVTKAYHKIEDNEGREWIKPRNYLSHEICIVKISGEEEKYYFGRFADTREFFDTVTQDIQIKYGTNTTGEDTKSSGSNSESNGGGHRKTRPQRDPKAVR